MSAMGRLPPVATGRNRPILLKKSAVVFKAAKYASEIEILNVRRASQAEISRRSALKRRFHRPILRQSEKPDFFNRIGQEPPLANGKGPEAAILMAIWT